jgi:hypothetical protein
MWAVFLFSPRPPAAYFRFPIGYDEWTEEEQMAFCEKIAEEIVEAAGGPEKAFPKKSEALDDGSP